MDRLVIDPNDVITLRGLCNCKKLIFHKYVRVVIGKRGPYIEFEKSHIIFTNFYIPKYASWRINSNIAYYNEYRSDCICNIKLYEQKKLVTYADYKLMMFYISPSYFPNFKLCYRNYQLSLF